MNSASGPITSHAVTWYRYFGSLYRPVILLMILLLVTVSPILALMGALLISTYARDMSPWWSVPISLGLVLLCLPLAALKAAHHARQVSLGVTDEGFIYRVPIHHYGGDAHIRFSDIKQFVRVDPQFEGNLFRLKVEHDSVAPARLGLVSGDAQFILTDAWITRPDSSLITTTFRLPQLERVHNIAFRPEAFDRQWRDGEIGRLLREHRPDLTIPEADAPLPLAWNPHVDGLV